MNRCTVIASLLLLLLTAAGFDVTQKQVDITAPDGTDIRRTYYDAARTGGPGTPVLDSAI
jgi:hypothetical protein